MPDRLWTLADAEAIDDQQSGTTAITMYMEGRKAARRGGVGGGWGKAPALPAYSGMGDVAATGNGQKWAYVAMHNVLWAHGAAVAILSCHARQRSHALARRPRLRGRALTCITDCIDVPGRPTPRPHRPLRALRTHASFTLPSNSL